MLLSINVFPNASNANQNKSFLANNVLFFNAGMFLISSFVSIMLGIGKFFPFGNSDGPNTYPEPMFIPAVCVYKLIIKFGNMAHFFCCNDEFAYSMARVFDGPHINAPLDFIVVKNSDRFMFVSCLYFYPNELSFAICVAICANRSDVAFPPAPPDAV